MKKFVHDHVVSITAILSVISLGLVFYTAGGYIPSQYLPRNDFILNLIPHFNAVLSIIAILSISKAVSYAIRGEIENHQKTMLFSFGVFVLFLTLYLYKVAIVGTADFGGPENIKMFIYLPFLLIHIALAVICVPLVFYSLSIGLTHTIEEIKGTRHAKVGRVATKLWIISFLMGGIVYLMAYQAY
jgi:putative membrane protein